MTPDQHAQVKELFLQARELSEDDRAEFLRKECGEDAELIREVTSLIRHDTTDTILTRSNRPAFQPFQGVGRAPKRVFSEIERKVSQILQRIFGDRRGQLIVVLVVVLSLLGLAAWTHQGMLRASRSIANSELETILNAAVTAMELWIEEKKKDVRLWSSQPNIQQAAAEDLKNFSVFCNHITVPPPIKVLLDDPHMILDGFVGPGHVSMVIGIEPYRFIARDYGLSTQLEGVNRRTRLDGDG